MKILRISQNIHTLRFPFLLLFAAAAATAAAAAVAAAAEGITENREIVEPRAKLIEILSVS